MGYNFRYEVNRMSSKYLLKTYGCQMNSNDSERLAGMLENMGYEKTDSENEADIIIFNTCCVRETAENKVIGHLGELKRLKQKKPDLIIGVCGCMVQQADMADKLKTRLSHIDLLFGTHNIHNLPELIYQVRESGSTIIEVWSEQADIVEEIPVKREEGIKAWVTIMYGCNNFCTYCIVPYVRGRERSRAPQSIIEEIQKLASEGYQEITLLGQNVNSYGKDFSEPYDFADLLTDLDKIEGVPRIKYMTSHPKDFSDKLIEVIANSKNVCEYFHLPVQAGSDNILKAMNRGYTKKQYLELIAKIKKAVPNAAISTDLIVGFPGETEAEFQETLDVLSKVNYDLAFTFIYNKRSGTPAADMENQVSDQEKKARIQRLVELQNSITFKRNQSEEGKIHRVLVDGFSKTNKEKLSGRTRTNKIVIFSGTEELIGKVVSVKITEGKPYNLEGEISIE